MNAFHSLLRLLPHFVIRTIKERYIESVMGLLWAVLRPAALILLYWFVFSVILQFRIRADTGDIPYGLYLLTGLMPWFMFQGGVSAGAASIIQKQHILTKVVIPAELFPLSSVISVFLPFIAVFLCFALALQIWMGQVSAVCLGLVVILLVFQLILVCGIALILSALSVYIRDILQILEVGLPALLFTAPIFWSLSMVPDRLSVLIYLNPFTPFVVAYRGLILQSELPGMALFLYIMLISVGTAWFGAVLFTKLKRGFADVL